MIAKNVTARLDGVELAALRQLPGDTDAERLRNLVRAVGATDGLAEKIAAAVGKEIAATVSADGDRTRQDFHQKMDAAAKQIIDAHGAVMRKFIEALNPILMELVDSAREGKKLRAELVARQQAARK